MAADLKDTPTAGLNVQLCGDAHLSNFGAFASPERTLLFGLNDFDETLPGPFEYDVKRMAASFTIAARNNGFTRSDARAATLESVASYRAQMAEFAEMRTMDIWYARLSEQELLSGAKDAARALKRAGGKDRRKTAAKAAAEAGTKGAHSRQLASAVEAGRARRWPIPDRQPTTGCDPVTRPGPHHRSVRRRDGTRDSRSVPGLPRDVAGRSPTPPREVRDRRHGSQGRGRRQRRDAGIHRAAAGSRSRRPLVLAGQGGDGVGPGRPPAKEPLPPSRRTRGPGPTTHAGRKRHLPGLDERPRGESLPLLAPAARHEGFGTRRDHDPGGTHVLRASLRSNPGAEHTPVPAIQSRSPRTWARRTGSNGRSPTSPNATPTRTSGTIKRSPRRSGPAGSRRSRTSDRTTQHPERR